MAELVLGIGSSHSPMCTLSGTDWLVWGQGDKASPFLYTIDGERLSYEDAVAAADESIMERITPEVCEDAAVRAHAAIDRLVDEIAAARLDAVIVVGDDQDEHLLSGNLPPFLVYWGDTVTNRATDPDDETTPAIVRRFMPAYAEPDVDREHAVATDLAKHLIETAYRRDFDVATSDRLPIEGRALGHAFAFALRRLGCAGIPIVPVMINTYNPPAVPRAGRCASFGAMLRAAVDLFPGDLRVGVIASGGLSHFLVLEDLDRTVLDAFERSDLATVTSIDESAFLAGTSEIKNWITVAAMCPDARFELIEYVPGYRTPGATGTGLAFAVWRFEEDER